MLACFVQNYIGATINTHGCFRKHALPLTLLVEKFKFLFCDQQVIAVDQRATAIALSYPATFDSTNYDPHREVAIVHVPWIWQLLLREVSIVICVASLSTAIVD